MYLGALVIKSATECCKKSTPLLNPRRMSPSVKTPSILPFSSTTETAPKPLSVITKSASWTVVSAKTTVQEALFVITDKGLGAVSVVDEEGKMLGVLTDGDIRRGLSKGVDFLQRSVADLMTKAPKYITADKLAAQALHLMESNQPKPITVLPVLDENKVVIGLLHMTDLVRQGVV